MSEKPTVIASATKCACKLGIVEHLHREVERQRRHDLPGRVGRQLAQSFGDVRRANFAQGFLQFIRIAVHQVEQLRNCMWRDIDHEMPRSGLSANSVLIRAGKRKARTIDILSGMTVVQILVGRTKSIVRKAVEG